MIYKVRFYGDPVLRRRAKPVSVFDERLAALAQDMMATMYEANGVGLAAPQIGLSERVFVALELTEREAEEDAEGEVLTSHEEREKQGIKAEHVMVNPKIVARNSVQYGTDGCLSLPGIFVEDMKRDQHIRLRYQDVTGKQLERDAEGHFAHVIQHELDHLDGVLFFDWLPEPEKREFLELHRKELAELQREAKGYLKELKTKGATDSNDVRVG